MSFTGFVYFNDIVNRVCKDVEGELNAIFDCAVQPRDDSAYVSSVLTGDMEAQKHVETIVGQFSQIDQKIICDGDRIRTHFSDDNMNSPSVLDRKLTHQFMDSALGLTPSYHGGGMESDVYAVFAELNGNNLEMRMVSLEAINTLALPAEMGVSLADVKTIDDAFGRYMDQLENSIFRAGLDCTLEQHAVAALKTDRYASASECHLQVWTYDTGKQDVIQSHSAVLNRHSFKSQLAGSSYAQRLRLGQMGLRH